MVSPDKRNTGFTLLELMITVVVLGILATLAAVGYSRYVGRARLSEATAMVAEMVSKQVVYYTEFAQYVQLRDDAGGDAVISAGTSHTEVMDGFFPTNLTSAWRSARDATSVGAPATWPVGWRSLGLRPKAQFLYCTYFGAAGVRFSGPVATSYGARMMTILEGQPTPWFYVLGACNLTGALTPGTLDNVTVVGMSYDRPTLQVQNDGM